MKIISQEDINGGGNCIVTELIIEDGGNLKSITIDAESIVGRTVAFEDDDGTIDVKDLVLWVVTDEDYSSEIPAEIAKEVLSVHRNYNKMRSFYGN